MQKILVVDDSETMRQMVKMTLQTGGYEVVLANDGEEGLRKFKDAGSVSLVVTDINMPIMDGLQLIRAIRKKDTAVPILALTTESEDEIRKKGAAAGANGWVVKPFKPTQFLDIVRQIL